MLAPNPEVASRPATRRTGPRKPNGTGRVPQGLANEPPGACLAVPQRQHAAAERPTPLESAGPRPESHGGRSSRSAPDLRTPLSTTNRASDKVERPSRYPRLHRSRSEACIWAPVSGMVALTSNQSYPLEHSVSSKGAAMMSTDRKYSLANPLSQPASCQEAPSTRRESPWPGYTSQALFNWQDHHPRRHKNAILHLRDVYETLELPQPNLKKIKVRKEKSQTLNRLNSMLHRKRFSGRSASSLLHTLRLAIHDERSELALATIEHLTTTTMKRTRTAQVNYLFVMAMTKRMEAVAITLFERGVPADVNAPILYQKSKKSLKPRLLNPSYFLLAVSFNLRLLVHAMVKRADVNQTWYGMSPLLLASFVGGTGDAALVGLLLQHEADPNLGIPLELLHCHRSVTSKHRNPNTGPPPAALKIPARLGTSSEHGHRVVTPSLSQSPRSRSTSNSIPKGQQGTSRPNSPSQQQSKDSAGVPSNVMVSSCIPAGSNVSKPTSYMSLSGKSGGSREESTRLSVSGAGTSPGVRATVSTSPFCVQRPSVEHWGLFRKWRKSKIVYPVDCAASVGNTQVVSLFLEKMTPSTLSENSFAHLVHGNLDISLKLLKAGVRIHQCDWSGSTALHLAASAGNIGMLALCLVAGANIDSQRSTDKCTPLHLAVASKQKAAAQVLVRHGADKTKRNAAGLTPMALGPVYGLYAQDLEQYFEPKSCPVEGEPYIRQIQKRAMSALRQSTHGAQYLDGRRERRQRCSTGPGVHTSQKSLDSDVPSPLAPLRPNAKHRTKRRSTFDLLSTLHMRFRQETLSGRYKSTSSIPNSNSRRFASTPLSLSPASSLHLSKSSSSTGSQNNSDGGVSDDQLLSPHKRHHSGPSSVSSLEYGNRDALGSSSSSLSSQTSKRVPSATAATTTVEVEVRSSNGSNPGPGAHMARRHKERSKKVSQSVTSSASCPDISDKTRAKPRDELRVARVRQAASKDK